MQRGRIPVALAVLVCVLALTATAIALSSPRGSGPSSSAYVPGEVLIKFSPNAQPADIAGALTSVGAVDVNKFLSGAHHWRLGPGISVTEAMTRLGNSPLVQYVEPNYLLSVDIMPNDPRVGELWAMNNTGQTGGTVDADIDADMA